MKVLALPAENQELQAGGVEGNSSSVSGCWHRTLLQVYVGLSKLSVKEVCVHVVQGNLMTLAGACSSPGE